ncbi:MAG: tripartite tricarboxylate transporter permease, partial [Candidatus Methanomethylicus sp.]|nr:tripartite tricarboxylate transporter permease [Candidatus Methanomethylicus sp.]
MDDFILGTIHLFTDPISIAIFFLALVSGLIFGAIPGISGMTLAAIFLPYSAFLTMPHALIFYGTLYCSGVYSGGVTAILFNIPGDVEDAPTALDGYPMTKKGEAGKAIGLSVVCAGIGGVTSAILMMIGTETISRWAIHSISSVEMFSIVFLAISIIAGMGSKSVIKGWISILIGMLIGTVGMDPVGGYPRFAFGSYYVMSGINFSALILGFFAITEVFVQTEEAVIGVAQSPQKGPMRYPSFIEFWRLKFSIIRSTIIGFFVGLLPGAGSAV